MHVPARPPRAYAFLDRDGTLVPERADAAWAGRRAVELLPGAGDALTLLAHAGWALVVVTNQYPIGEGVVTPRDYARQCSSLVHQVRRHGVELLDVLHCPHARASTCRCAKPGPAMVERAVARHGRLDRRRSVVIGDADADMGLAAAVGVRGLRVEPSLLGQPPARVDLLAVVRALVAERATAAPWRTLRRHEGSRPGRPAQVRR